MSEIVVSGLLAPDALLAQLGDDNLVILDIRSAIDGGGRAAYEAGHIPGAVHTDYVVDGWRATIGNAPGMLPPLDHLSALVGRLGIKPHDDVVIVPAGVSATDFAAAARIYWTLKTIGHGQQAILDGGFRAWAEGSRPVETGTSAPKGADPYPVVMQQRLRSTADATLIASRSKFATLVDARSASYFDGQEKAPEAARAGHIPGAVSHDYTQAFDPATGRLKPRDELAKLFGAVPKGPAISYCNTGHTAALNWFVMSEVLGRDEVALYDGSMTDWTQDPDRPVATNAC
ncbi:hypothetical protein IP69_05055 [Bosea sp. AAP35]|uniref:sulfurtransferase n=1 Tax=Bosea sp. AAP35 TaxID=1523417 RepID=UPI0006B8CA67|nr:sulfurtransferase [Bosea sp. AAP35]KPF71845.1 hypothetical protein IP69_05055 [Bosea sp. AAP35]